MWKCIKCDEMTPVRNTLSAGRDHRICKLCYNAQRALATHFKKRGQKEYWEKMNSEKKKRMIIRNKGTGGTKGKERELDLEEGVAHLHQPASCLR